MENYILDILILVIAIVLGPKHSSILWLNIIFSSVFVAMRWSSSQGIELEWALVNVTAIVAAILVALEMKRKHNDKI